MSVETVPPHPHCGQPPTLLMSMVSRASCLRRSLRSRLLSEEEATPPLPVLPPGLCWKSMVQAWGLQGTRRNLGEQGSRLRTLLMLPGPGAQTLTRQAGPSLVFYAQNGVYIIPRATVDQGRNSQQPKFEQASLRP